MFYLFIFCCFFSESSVESLFSIFLLFCLFLLFSDLLFIFSCFFSFFIFLFFYLFLDFGVLWGIIFSQNEPAINSWWFGGWKPWRFTAWNHQLCLKATSYQARCTGSPFSIVVASPWRVVMAASAKPSRWPTSSQKGAGICDEKLRSGMVTFIGFTTLSQKMWYFVISF